MSAALTIPQTNTGAIGPGKLVLVVGPSGAGKDTLLGLAQAASADDPKIVFVRRVVTREASSAEDNEPESVHVAYGLNLPRLRAIKAKYDPGNLFRPSVNILPA